MLSADNPPEVTAPEPLVVDVYEAARLLKLNHRTVRKYVAAGQIPALRIGDRILISREKLNDMVNGTPQIVA